MNLTDFQIIAIFVIFMLACLVGGWMAIEYNKV